MRLAIAKIGANITFGGNNRSAANADIKYFLRQLEVDYHEITIATGITRNTFIPSRLNLVDVKDLVNFNGFDAVIVFNGSINFFGGQPDYNLLALYQALSNTYRPIIYINTDGQLMFKQLWPLIHKREWASNMSDDMFDINSNNVSYITQGHNLDRMRRMTESKPENIKPGKMFYYPLAQCILAKHEQYIKPNPIPYKERTYEIGFGGATRNTFKRNKIEKFYGTGLHRTLLFGNLRGVQVKPDSGIVIQRPCGYSEFIARMWNCKATIIIGDESYSDNFWTLRMYESILADNITFIDRQFDPRGLFYDGIRGADHLYVASPHNINLDPRFYEQWTQIRADFLNSYDEDTARFDLNETLAACVQA